MVVLLCLLGPGGAFGAEGGAREWELAVRAQLDAQSRLAAEADRYVDPSIGWSIRPPDGFTLASAGKKTIWRGPGGLELLVETERSPRGTPIGDWVDLHRRYQRARGPRYRLIGIQRSTLAGRPGAVWEFELDGVRKVDYATHAGGVGYAVMISGPRSGFAKNADLLERAVDSFRLPGS